MYVRVEIKAYKCQYNLTRRINVQTQLVEITFIDLLMVKITLTDRVKITFTDWLVVKINGETEN